MISLIFLSIGIASVSAGYLDSPAYGYASAPAVDLTYGYGAPSYGAPTPSYGAPSYGAPSYAAPSYAAPIVKAYAPTATSYSNTYHIAKSIPVPAYSAAPIYKAASVAYGAPAYGVPAALSPAYGPSYGAAPAYGHGYYGPSYSHGYLH